MRKLLLTIAIAAILYLWLCEPIGYRIHTGQGGEYSVLLNSACYAFLMLSIVLLLIKSGLLTPRK